MTRIDVADERNEPRYNHQMAAAELLTPEPIGRGSRGHPMRTDGALTFEPVPGGTRMRWAWQVETRGAMKLIGPLVVVLGRRQERRIWGELERLLEEGTR